MWMDADTFGKIMTWHTKAILSQVSAMIADREPPLAREGVVVGGSWDARDGTVEVIIGDAYAIAGDDNIIPDSGVTVTRLPLLSTHVGDQYGPVGNERALLIPSQSGYHVLLHHGSDDSQQNLPSGERWISHYDSSGTINAFTKLTNDAETTGDGLASNTTLAGGLSKTTTTSGHTSSMSDTTRKILQQSADGHLRQIVDVASDVTPPANIMDQTVGGLQTIHNDATHEIAHVAPNVNLGAVGTGLTSAETAINKTHLTEYDTSLASARASDLGKLVQGMIAANVPNAGGIIALFGPNPASAIPTSALLPVTIPSGSSVVKMVT